MKRYKRIFTIVVDSLGVGALPDAADYGDAGTDTLGHISQRMEQFHIPNLQKLGMANLHPLKQVEAVERPMGYFACLSEASAGKDTMTGHWEMMGERQRHGDSGRAGGGSDCHRAYDRVYICRFSLADLRK